MDNTTPESDKPFVERARRLMEAWRASHRASKSVSGLERHFAAWAMSWKRAPAHVLQANQDVQAYELDIIVQALRGPAPPGGGARSRS